MRNAMLACLVSVGLVLSGAVATAQVPDAPPAVKLYPGVAPGSEGKGGEEVYVPATPEENWSQLYNIHVPSITPYLPDPDKATGAAIVICPGGGYEVLAWDHEGVNIGQWFAERGIAGFVLKYRLSRDRAGASTYTIEGDSLADAQRAIQMVRSRAAEWNVDPDKIGIIGFSAGGNVAALASNRFAAAQPDADDPVARFGSRPDFSIIMYPAPAIRSIEVSERTPPSFLCQAADDMLGLTGGFLPYIEKLYRAGVSLSVTIYADGGHGFGLRPEDDRLCETWPERVQEWMGEMGIIDNDK